MDRKPDHGERAAVDPSDVEPSQPLEGVGAGFVHGLTGIHIPYDFLFGHGQHLNLGHIDQRPYLRSPIPEADGETGEHLVEIALKSTKHSPCLLRVAWLAHHLALVDHRGVTSYDEKPLGSDRACFGPSDALDVGSRSLLRMPGFVDVGRADFICELQRLEQLDATGRVGGQNESQVRILPIRITTLG